MCLVHQFHPSGSSHCAVIRIQIGNSDPFPFFFLRLLPLLSLLPLLLLQNTPSLLSARSASRLSNQNTDANGPVLLYVHNNTINIEMNVCPY